MKNTVLIFSLSAALAGCAAIDAVGERIPGGSEVNQSEAPSEMVDAVTRRPIQNAGLAPAPQPYPEPTIEVEPEPLPDTEVVYSGDAVEQVIDPSLDPSTARSYNATWEDGGFRHRSVMFPHIIDGCKVMIQSRRTLDYVAGTTGEFVEREGPDCNCDLVIDGFEDIFAQLNDEYKTPRMYDVCAGPGVDGATRQLEIMRESLKENRNFDKMKNVDGF